MLKPKPLKKGGTMGFVGTSGAMPDPSKLERAVQMAEKAGYRVVVGESCAARYGYLSGGDSLRADDLNRMFEDEGIDAIVVIRGGYGAPRILDRLDYEAAARHPKPLIGYSDVTALHLAYLKNPGLITYHAPMPMSDWLDDGFLDFSMGSLLSSLDGAQVGVPLRNPEGFAGDLLSLQGGKAEGRLIGGNLTLMSSLMGTKYMPDLTGAILLLEDVDEHWYRIDRLLTHLRLAGAFDACAGVVFGTFVNCAAEYEDRSLTLAPIISDIVLPAGKPVVSGRRIGHWSPDKLTMPLGARYSQDGDKCELTHKESPTA